MILSMIPIVLPDDTPAGCMPYGQTVLASILPSSFTPLSRIRHRSIENGSRLPMPAVARSISFLARANLPI
jgi:hypothetical protein